MVLQGGFGARDHGCGYSPIPVGAGGGGVQGA